MRRVFDPASVDFSDTALPPGMTAEKIHTIVKLALADFVERGWQSHIWFINPDETTARKGSMRQGVSGGVFGRRRHTGRTMPGGRSPRNQRLRLHQAA